MARSIRDDLKRKVAQAVNHLAQAIVDINAVYEEFKKYEKPETEYLVQVMLQMSRERDALIAFAGAAWELDEMGLISYL